jgi:hypothetical protein
LGLDLAIFRTGVDHGLFQPLSFLPMDHDVDLSIERVGGRVSYMTANRHTVALDREDSCRAIVTLGR